MPDQDWFRLNRYSERNSLKNDILAKAEISGEPGVIGLPSRDQRSGKHDGWSLRFERNRPKTRPGRRRRREIGQRFSGNRVASGSGGNSAVHGDDSPVRTGRGYRVHLNVDLIESGSGPGKCERLAAVDGVY